MTRKLIILLVLLLMSITAFAQSYEHFKPNSIGFEPFVSPGVTFGPYSVFCADLDGDLDMDLAVANENGNSVSIFKNNGDGNLQIKVDYETGTRPRSVFCADLDGDLDLDLAVANLWGDSVSIFINNGDGTFQTKVDYSAGDSPNSVFCGDLDGDLDLDLAVANFFGSKVTILENNGYGAFQVKADYVTRGRTYSVFCADLDGDSDLDLAVGSSGFAHVFKNSGNGAFEDRTDYVVGSSVQSVFCADLDGDSDLDLAAANEYYDDNRVSILMNNGDGTFQAQVDYETGDDPYCVYCADLDGDLDLDLVTANLRSDSVSVLKNNGDGTFQAKVDYAVGDCPTSVFCSDLDGDTDLDLAVTNLCSDNISILKNKGDGTFERPDIDLTLELWGLGRARPGFERSYDLLYSNKDTSTAYNVTITFTLPSQVIYHSSTPPGSLSYNVITWDIGTVLGEAAGTVEAQVSIPGDVTDGSVLTSAATIQTTGPEKDLTNNSDLDTAVVVASWDPYDKEVYPYGSLVAGDQELRYTIYFENLCSATEDAISITILDTLDQNLDSTTLSLGPMSHPDKCTSYFNSIDRVITWSCDSIMLPPNVNPPEGEGFVVFIIYPESGLIPGTTIENRAYIQLNSNPWIPAPASGSVIKKIGVCGDYRGNQVTSISDVVGFLGYLFKSGPPPVFPGVVDANCDGLETIADAVYIVNYLFKSGPA
ncbi:MAG: FG-GAP-like repeat-containing protein, partial [Candidatus Zixiibacteriota bacterium]